MGRRRGRVFAKKATDVAREIERDGGYFGTELIREQLNYFLRTKLTQHHADAARDVEVPERVRFCDMSPSIAPECCSLKVIVTDVTNRRMIVFDNSDEYQNVEVAEAVAASISIPFVFKPARIPSYDEQPDALYADGGMVSNLPIWVFAEEKLNYERSQMPKSRVPRSRIFPRRARAPADQCAHDGRGLYLSVKCREVGDFRRASRRDAFRRRSRSGPDADRP